VSVYNDCRLLSLMLGYWEVWAYFLVLESTQPLAFPHEYQFIPAMKNGYIMI